MKFARKFLYQILRFLGHQDWLRFGIRYRLIQIFCDPYKSPPFTFVVDYFGFRYEGKLNDVLDWTVYFFGAYEKSELLLLKSMLKIERDSAFVDIGANMGLYTLFMSKYCKQIYSFEPYTEVREKLKARLQQNNIENVEVFSVGLGAKANKKDFFGPIGRNRATGSFMSEHEKGRNSFFGKLEVACGDYYLANLDKDDNVIIKIDVEGYEKYALQGLRETLIRCRPIVLMEYSSTTKRTFAEIGELKGLLPEKYEIKVVKSNNRRLGLFNSPRCVFGPFDENIIDINLLLFPDNTDLLA